jgi:putative endonuclease
MNAVPNPKRESGQRGEQIAAAYLQQRGYVILTTNWRCTRGEIDIVARKGETLVFVEVRARKQGIDSAFESVGARKQQRMVAAAQVYLSDYHLEEALWQVDIIAVSLPYNAPPAVEHVENALDW